MREITRLNSRAAQRPSQVVSIGDDIIREARERRDYLSIKEALREEIGRSGSNSRVIQIPRLPDAKSLSKMLDAAGIKGRNADEQEYLNCFCKAVEHIGLMGEETAAHTLVTMFDSLLPNSAWGRFLNRKAVDRLEVTEEIKAGVGPSFHLILNAWSPPLTDGIIRRAREYRAERVEDTAFHTLLFDSLQKTLRRIEQDDDRRPRGRTA